MRCGRCGAEAMLGSAQCGRCGASLLDGSDVEVPQVTAGPLPKPTPVVTAPPPAPPPIPVDASPVPGYAAPPPPPPGWTAGSGSPGPAPGAARTTVRSPRAKAGCGCVGPLVILVISLAAVSVFGGISLFDAVDDASDGGEVQDEGVLRIGVAERGGIGTRDTDRWRLDGRAGEFQFDVRADGDFDPRIEVREVEGRSLGSNDDRPGTRDSRLVVALEEGVDYHVDVTGFGDSSGDYEIEVTSTDVPPVEGGTLSIGTPIEGTVADNGSVRYRFTGEGREVAISVRGHDGFDPVVRVLGEDGSVLAENDDFDGRDSRVQVTVPGGATVVVEVTGFNDDGGRYTVDVT